MKQGMPGTIRFTRQKQAYVSRRRIADEAFETLIGAVRERKMFRILSDAVSEGPQSETQESAQG